MKYYFLCSCLFLFTYFSIAQSPNEHYTKAMSAYTRHDYAAASAQFHKIDEKTVFQLSSNQLYDGACILALNHEHENSLRLLNYLAEKRFYSNINHISTDEDLIKLHGLPSWTALMRKIQENLKTLPQRTLGKVRVELLKARSILLTDNGKLWGEQLWSNNIIILGPDNVIYTLQPFSGSVTDDSIVYRKKIENGLLSQTNSAQNFEGKPYAVIMTSYLNDSSSTLIHELFHILQYSHIQLNGNPVNYLDDYEPRQWLRLEFEALRNALISADERQNNKASDFLSDALLFRKLRQIKYPGQIKSELEIETSEGLSNYTGFILSTYPDKYAKTIREINEREGASSYTRSFAYATGPAYGMLFDFFKIPWKTGLTKVYNFLEIYEDQYLHRAVNTSDGKHQLVAYKRNNYEVIHHQENDRAIQHRNTINYFTDLFIHKPTLTVVMSDSIYSRSYDMNGTVVLNGIGIVYPNIIGTDITGKNFGSFKAQSTVDSLMSGVLGDFESHKFTFSLPVKVEEDNITGKGYSIHLNPEWHVIKKDEQGNLEIVRK